MKFTKLSLLSILLLVIFATALPCAAQSAPSIGNDDIYRCVLEEGYGYLEKFKRGAWRPVGFKHRKKAKRKTNRYLRRYKQLTRNGNLEKADFFHNLYEEWNTILTGMNNCYDTDGGEGGGGTTPAPVPTPGGGGGNTAGACSIFGSSTSSDSGYTPKIINGNECSIGDSPVVQLALLSNGSPLGDCTGTAISSTVILTAAHCLMDGQNGEKVTGVTITTGFGSVSASSFASHPSFNENATAFEVNDVAIVVAASALGTQTMSLLSSNDLQVSEQVAIAGFGMTESEFDPLAYSLRAGYMAISSVTSEAIEALYSPGGENANTCSGDSGGPLAVSRNDAWVLAGVTSNGDNQSCGTNGQSDTSRWANATSTSNRAFIGQYVTLD
ncbi:trypsin-like serine protease [Oligoflexia bacterium]|nr:trypsin-like serine protease [Oligoflexia bacterium]